MLSKDSNQELSVEVCNLAFKVGELLAKTELLTNRALVTEFVERVINEITKKAKKQPLSLQTQNGRIRLENSATIIGLNI